MPGALPVATLLRRYAADCDNFYSLMTIALLDSVTGAIGFNPL